MGEKRKSKGIKSGKYRYHFYKIIPAGSGWRKVVDEAYTKEGYGGAIVRKNKVYVNWEQPKRKKQVIK